MHLCQSTTSAFPYTHYFYSGIGGSGLAVLSRDPIKDVFQYRFQPNGKPYRLKHADWFGAKVIGCCRIDHRRVGIVDVHTTHLHAEYNRSCDEYLAHRTAQAFQAAKFINLVSSSCYNNASNGEMDLNRPGLVVLAGDMNFEPTDCAYRVYKYLGGLVDVWSDTEAGKRAARNGECGDTCDAVDNPYTSEAKKHQSKRIDYVFHKHVDRKETSDWFKCVACAVTMKNVPNRPFSFSDHYGIEATFERIPAGYIEEGLERDFCVEELAEGTGSNSGRVKGKRPKSTSDDGRASLKLEAMNIIDEGLDDALERRGGNIFNLYLFASLWILFFAATFWGFHIGMYLQYVHPPLMLIALYYFFIGYVFGNSEVNALRQVQSEMRYSFGFLNSIDCLGEEPLNC